MREDVINSPIIDTTSFNGNLDDSTASIQELARKVDQLPLGVADAPADSVYYGRRNSVWTNLKTYFDTLYAAITHNHSGTYEPANANIQSHIANTSNPHAVTAAQVGAGAYTDTTAWTVNVYGTTTRGTCAYTTREANYARVGNMVFVSLNVIWTGHTGTGNMQLDVLPVVPVSNTPLTVYFSVITLTAVGNKLMAVTTAGQTYIIIYEVGSSLATAVPMDASVALKISGFYFV